MECLKYLTSLNQHVCTRLDQQRCLLWVRWSRKASYSHKFWPC